MQNIAGVSQFCRQTVDQRSHYMFCIKTVGTDAVYYSQMLFCALITSTHSDTGIKDAYIL